MNSITEPIFLHDFAEGAISSVGASVATPPAANLWASYLKGTGITQAGGFVSQWADQSGNGRHLIQGTGANQPTTDGSTITGDGLTQSLQTGAQTLNNGCTFYWRMRQLGWTSGDFLMDGRSAVNTGRVSQETASPGLNFYAGAFGGLNNEFTIGAWFTLTVVFNGASSQLRCGLNAAVTGNAGAANMGGLTLFSIASGGNYGNFQVAEGWCYSVAHSTAQQNAIIPYLNTK